MSQNNSIQGYPWESQLEENRDLAGVDLDEVLSVYEVYVKDDGENQDGKSDVSGDSSDPPDYEFINGDDLDLEAAINADIMDSDKNVTKIFSKDSNIPVLTRNKPQKNFKDTDVPYSETMPKASSSSGPRMIDKDDPRSRLHFVKYLKRDGATLKIWECGICSKEFRHQYTLMRHLPTHTDERNFKCDACGKAFRQLSTLSQHKAIHSDARPYVCEYCKKTFNRVSTLISHRKTHSENKPHKCPVCGKGFHQKGNLRNHVFTHTNERPYKCESCGKGFNQMSNLVCHKVKAHAHTEKMQYSCGICGDDFPRRFALRSHEEEKHGIKYRTPTTSSSSSSSSSSGTNKMKKNLKIVELKSDETMDTEDKENIQPEIIGNFLVNKIETKTMEKAIMDNQQPFALYKPANGIPVLVKVELAGPRQHLLTPATAEDLRMGEKTDEENGVQLKVPVVATVNQILHENGRIEYVIVPPDNEQDQGENLLTPLDAEFFMQDSLGDSERHSHNGSIDDCNELLELAAQGGIQFVRATEDGRYEVMSNSEARELMAQNSHDVTILEGADADAINAVGINNDEVVDNNQIMVLDGGGGRCLIKPSDIEIHEEKDIRILDTRNTDERFVDNVAAFFQQSKIDDFIVGGRAGGLSLETGMPLPSDDDCFISSHQDLSNILAHASDLTASIPPLLTKNESSIFVLNDNVPYLKNQRGFSDEFNLLNVDNNCMDDNSMGIYDTRMKLGDFDDLVGDHGLMGINQDLRLLGRCQTPMTMQLPSFNDMKILGPKYQEFEAASSCHDNVKIFGGYDDRYLRGNGYRSFESVDSSISDCKDIKILGEKVDEDYLVKNDCDKSNNMVRNYWTENNNYYDNNYYDFKYQPFISPNCYCMPYY